MCESPRTRLLARVFLPLLFLAGLGLLSAKLDAQAPPKKQRKDEVEEPQPAKKQRKEEVEETEPPKKLTPIRVGDEPSPGSVVQESVPQAVDFASAARRASSETVRELFRSLEVPHDLVTLRNGQEYVAELIPRYIGASPDANASLVVKTFKADGKPDIAFETRGRLRSVEPYEQVALRKVEEFLKQPDALVPPEAKSRAAAEVLATVLHFHEAAKKREKRQGAGWAEVEKSLRAKLREVELLHLANLVKANDWKNASALARYLTKTYPAAEDQLLLFRPLSKLAEDSIATRRTEEATQRLNLLENLFPPGSLGQPADGLAEEARKHLADARALGDPKSLGEKDRAVAYALLKLAAIKDPRLEGLREANRQLLATYPILRVGVRDLPEPGHLSPATAWTDPERWAVELMFEGLVRPTYDPKLGQDYLPELAIGEPRLLPLGRQFYLPPGASWSNGQPVTATDVVHTVQLLKDPNWSGRVPSWADLVEDAEADGTTTRVGLTLRQGYLDPLSLMTFKVLPQQRVPGQVLDHVDNPQLAAEPVGSGPYVYDKERSKGGEVVFVANPYYHRRPGKTGLPLIHEIHFYACKDPVHDFQDQNRRLGLLLALSTQDIDQLQKGVKDVVVETLPNRRIYFLAVNHRRQSKQNATLRRAIAYAIDRESLLKEFFRSPTLPNVHRALNGPYPPGSWACADASQVRADLFDARLAKTLTGKSGVRSPSLTLKYPEGDPKLDGAIKALCKGVEEHTGIKLEPVALKPRVLYEDVMLSHDYDLAYCHYDYPSETFSLWPLLDPRGIGQGAGGSNFLGYRDDERDDEPEPGQQRLRLLPLFPKAMAHRSFPQVRDLTHEIHAAFALRKMPFIPLWQLDTHVAYHADLQLAPSGLAEPHNAGSEGKRLRFDPLAIFTDVERWQFQRK